MASQITGVWSVCSTVCSGADEIKHQSSTSLAFMRGIHRWPVHPPHKGPIMRKMFVWWREHAIRKHPVSCSASREITCRRRDPPAPSSDPFASYQQPQQLISLVPRWPNVDPVGSTLGQRGPNVPCYLGSDLPPRTTRLASFFFHWPPHSWDISISDSDLESPMSRSWVWSRFLSQLVGLMDLTIRLADLILVDFRCDIDLQCSRSNMEFVISRPIMVRMPRNKKQTYRLNSKPQTWP